MTFSNLNLNLKMCTLIPGCVSRFLHILKCGFFQLFVCKFLMQNVAHKHNRFRNHIDSNLTNKTVECHQTLFRCLIRHSPTRQNIQDIKKKKFRVFSENICLKQVISVNFFRSYHCKFDTLKPETCSWFTKDKPLLSTHCLDSCSVSISNSSEPSVSFHIETSHLVRAANQMTSLYMKCNTGLK